MYNLGSLYDHGRGVEQSDAKAFGWFEQAARKGDAMAQYNVAVMLDTGRGCEVNVSKALTFFEQSAKQGFSQAQVSWRGRQDKEIPADEIILIILIMTASTNNQ